uniref:UDP-N-acetylglucosamine transferase subunit ALG13 n=1 Tax=Accipiter nisus TaxID=211598 RepID=A0A8B9S066_9AVES
MRGNRERSVAGGVRQGRGERREVAEDGEAGRGGGSGGPRAGVTGSGPGVRPWYTHPLHHRSHPFPPLLSPQVLQSRGYQKLVLQVGRGELKPAVRGSPALAVEAFRFKDSLAEDLRRADLVISHAGAGSCLETLEEGKPLIVVTNEKLMNNHQLELAKQLHRDGHVLYCNCRYGAAVAVLMEQAVFSTITRCVITVLRM